MTPAIQPRGIRRRADLLRAAVQLLTEGGFAAVTHRAVAQRADLPLAATTYYFASRDQLLAQAFSLLVEDELTALRHAVTAGGLLGALEELPHQRLRQLGLWELYVHAGRDPELQQIARAWSDGCLVIIADFLHLPPDDLRVQLVYATFDALWLEHVVEERHSDLSTARALLAFAIAAVP